VGYEVGNSSAGQVACTRAHGKHGYQQGVESFSYPFTTGAHHIIAIDMVVEKGARVIIIVGPFNVLNCYRLPKIWLGLMKSPSERLRQDASGAKWRYFRFRLGDVS
jgi:hypothetical protein